METVSTTERMSGVGRCMALVIALVTFGVLGLAAWLPPAPDGVGTHVRLNLPPCNWVTLSRVPCPTCGMTTSFAHVADGNLWEGFMCQPFGFVLAIGTVMTFWIALIVAVTGSTIYRSFFALWRPGFVWALAAVGFAAWIYKIFTYTYVGGSP